MYLRQGCQLSSILPDCTEFIGVVQKMDMDLSRQYIVRKKGNQYRNLKEKITECEWIHVCVCGT